MLTADSAPCFAGQTITSVNSIHVQLWFSLLHPRAEKGYENEAMHDVMWSIHQTGRPAVPLALMENGRTLLIILAYWSLSLTSIQNEVQDFVSTVRAISCLLGSIISHSYLLKQITNLLLHSMEWRTHGSRWYCSNLGSRVLYKQANAKDSKAPHTLAHTGPGNYVCRTQARSAGLATAVTDFTK